eukprot:350329-Chlamydomonas_euryale.AAC.1
MHVSCTEDITGSGELRGGMHAACGVHACVVHARACAVMQVQVPVWCTAAHAHLQCILGAPPGSGLPVPSQGRHVCRSLDPRIYNSAEQIDLSTVQPAPTRHASAPDAGGGHGRSRLRTQRRVGAWVSDA